MSADLISARTLAHMLFPERSDCQAEQGGESRDRQVCPAPERWPDLLAAARHNKVPLLWLDETVPAWAPFYASEVFRAARAEQERECARQRREFEPVRRTFEAAGIRGVMIKSVGRAPSWPYSSDNADVLVPLALGHRARSLLSDLGYIEVVNVEEPCKFLFRTFHGGEPASAIHLHEFVGWGTGFMDDEAVLAAARPAPDDPDLWIPAREDALLITLAHAFYEDKQVTLGDLAKVLHLLEQGPLDWERCWGQARLRGWEDGLAICIGLWSALETQLFGDTLFPSEVLELAKALAPEEPSEFLRYCLAHGTLYWPFRIHFALSKSLYYGKVRADTRLTERQKSADSVRHTLAGLKRR